MPSALIIGGTSGIGKATAELLQQRGYQVAVTGTNPDSLATTQRELGDGALVLKADLRSLPETDAAIAAVKEKFGTVDLLFLNGGVSRPSPVGDVTEEAFDDMVNINLKGQYFTLQKALPVMADGGSIIFTIGAGGHRGMPGGTVTTATKGGMLSLIPSLAQELAPRKIRVNAVSPGGIDTPIWDKLGVPAEMREAMAAGVPLGRFGTSNEIAETVAFLASEGAGYITGQEIIVAGGS